MFVLLKGAENGIWYKMRPRRMAGLENWSLLVGIRNLAFILRATEHTRGLKTGEELRESMVIQCEVYILK